MPVEVSETTSTSDGPGRGAPPARPDVLAQALETYEAARPGGSISRGNMILAGMILAGIGCIYVLSVFEVPSQATAGQSAIETGVDMAIEKRDKPSRTDLQKRAQTNRILATLNYKASERQIPPDDLRGNPFVFVPPSSGSPEPIDGEAERTVSAAASELSNALGAVQQLELQSILSGGSERIAIISDKLVHEGQTIQGWTVKQIQPRSVLLAWRNRTYVLKLPRQTSPQ